MIGLIVDPERTSRTSSAASASSRRPPLRSRKRRATTSSRSRDGSSAERAGPDPDAVQRSARRLGAHHGARASSVGPEQRLAHSPHGGRRPRFHGRRRIGSNGARHATTARTSFSTNRTSRRAARSTTRPPTSRASSPPAGSRAPRGSGSTRACATRKRSSRPAIRSTRSALHVVRRAHRCTTDIAWSPGSMLVMFHGMGPEGELLLTNKSEAARRASCSPASSLAACFVASACSSASVAWPSASSTRSCDRLSVGAAGGADREI